MDAFINDGRVNFLNRLVRSLHNLLTTIKDGFVTAIHVDNKLLCCIQGFHFHNEQKLTRRHPQWMLFAYITSMRILLALFFVEIIVVTQC